MAIDILSIPAMSDEPERVFSGARRTVSWERMQLGPENIEKAECLKNWHKSKISIEEHEMKE
jgi:hAT family C-terminal dimerisation region